MRALTRKSPARRNHAVLAYSDEHTGWIAVGEPFVDPETGCVKVHTMCVLSSDFEEDSCTAGDLGLESTCDDD